MIDIRISDAKELISSDPDEAVRLCSEVMNENPDSEDSFGALFLTAYAMLEAERFGLAYHLFSRCAELNPNQANIYVDMSQCFQGTDNEKMLSFCRKAIDIDPDCASAWANSGLAHLSLGHPDSCVTESLKALSLKPDLINARHNLSLAYLMKRDFKQGWKEYYRTHGCKHRERQDFGLPEWNGYQEGRILVYGEQGVGDEILFASCLPDLIKTNEVTLVCDSRLESIFRRSFDCTVFGDRYERRFSFAHDADFQIAIGQLPHFYRNSEYCFPGSPYLSHDPIKADIWRRLLSTYQGKKIGLSWSAGCINNGQKQRTIDPCDFSPLLDELTFTAVNLDYNDSICDQIFDHSLLSFPWVTKKGQDIDYLAALISQLDLVITACNTNVHVAGALGIPCIALVPSCSSYRYHVDGDTLPWYSCVRLFRQKEGEPWVETIQRLSKEIEC